MKFKLFNLLTVCLATSGLLAPAQAALADSVERQMNVEEAQHLVCVKEAQHWLCEVEKSGERDSESAPNQGAVKEAKATESLKSSALTVVPPLLTPAQQGTIANILLWFSYLLPCGLGLGIFLYDKYCVYRAAVLSEQIETLERLWQYESDNDATTDTERGARG
jgi:hypothetical protein